jgi:hypothetical protein
MRVCGLVAASTLLVACTSGTLDAGSASRPLPGEERSTPFTVEMSIPGWTFETAGVGSRPPEWGSDSAGTTSPFTILEVARRHAGTGLVTISLRSSLGVEDFAPGVFISLSPGNREAHFRPDLVVDIDSDPADHVDLEEVLRQVELPKDHWRPPTLAHVPNGLHLVGSFDAYAVAALAPDGPRGGNVGPPPAHSMSWRNAYGQLVVLTLPGRSLSLDAVELGARRLASHQILPDQGWDLVAVRRTVAGRPGLLLEYRSRVTGHLVRRTIVSHLADGQIVIVTVRGDRHIPFARELVRVAGSIEPTAHF